jgi:hypothetical protein
MVGLFRLLRTLMVLAALAAAAQALWRRRERIEEVWGSLGGTEGVVNHATKLVESAGPVRDFVTQVANLKK